MKEHPILMGAEMVRAILNGRKLQTRRIIKSQPVNVVPFIGADEKPTWEYGICQTHERVINKHAKCPFGKPGDRLWVREAWAMTGNLHGEPYPVYRATADGLCWSKPWKPSIHMPRWASRITLEITGVRVERIQSISEEDAIAEGCRGGHDSIPEYPFSATPKEHFQHLWESTYPGSWERNDWVWVIDFKKV